MQWIDKHPLVICLGFLLVFFLSFQGIRQLEVDYRIYDIVDDSFPETLLLKDYSEDFEDGQSVIVFLQKNTQSSFSYREICTLNEFLFQSNAHNPEIKTIRSFLIAPAPSYTDNRLFFPQILPDPCDDEILDPDAAFHLEPLKDSVFKELAYSNGGDDIGFEVEFHSEDFQIQYIHNFVESLQNWILTHDLDFSLFLAGRTSTQYFIWESVQSNLWINAVAMIISFLMITLTLGRWRLGLYFGLNCLLIGLLVYGSMGLAGSSVDVLGANIFIMLVITALQDFFFIFYSTTHRSLSLEKSVRKYIVPGLMTSATTVVGFITLLSASQMSIQKFGLWAAYGSFCAWLVSFVFVPALLKVLRLHVIPNARDFSKKFSYVLQRVQSFIAQFSFKIPAMIALVAAIFFIPQLDYEEDISQNFPPDHMAFQSLEFQKTTRGFQGSINLVFEAGDLCWKEYLDLGQEDSPFQYSIDRRSREAIFYQNTAPELHPVIKENLASVGVFDFYWNANRTLERSLLFLKSYSVEHIGAAVSDLEALKLNCDIDYFGEAVVYHSFATRVMSALLSSLGTSLALIGLLLSIWAFSVGGLGLAWKVLLSALWGPLLMLGFMAFFKIPISQVTCIFTAVMAGIAGDNSLWYLKRRDKTSVLHEIHAEGIVSMSIALTMCMTVSPLLFHTLVPFNYLGALLFLGFLINLFGDHWLFSSLLKK